MPLSNEQLVTLKAYIQADPSLSAQPNNPDGWLAISKSLNLTASPAFVVWKSRVTEAEVFAASGMDWTRVDNLSAGKARVWEWLFKFGGADPSRPNVRTGIDAVWVGTAADLAVRAAVYVECKRNATTGEKLFATGTGTTGSPAAMSYEGAITPADVELSLNPPA